MGGEVMPNFICTTCGTQYAETQAPPSACAICQDERQYVTASGQTWTTLDKLRLSNRSSIQFEEPGLIGIGIDPPFAIGQREFNMSLINMVRIESRCWVDCHVLPRERVAVYSKWH